MIHQNVELHNISEVEKLWNGSYELQRVPKSDMLHPSDFGMSRMAENLAVRLKKLLERNSV